MKCKNCGADVKWDDKFCQGCGTCLDSDYKPEDIKVAENKRDEHKKTVMNALNNAFSSPQFLIACIFLSATLALQLFYLKDAMDIKGASTVILLVHVMPILVTIFMWITYANASKRYLEYEFTSIKVLDKLARVQTIIGWATAIGLIVLYIASYSLTKTIENGTVESVKEATETLNKITKLFFYILLAGSMYNITVFIMGIYAASLLFSGSEDLASKVFVGNTLFKSVTGVVIVIAIAIILITIFFTGSIKKTLFATILSAETGNVYRGNYLLAEVGMYIMAGVIFLVLRSTMLLLLYAAYVGFMISAGLSIRKLSNELRRTLA